VPAPETTFLFVTSCRTSGKGLNLQQQLCCFSECYVKPLYGLSSDASQPGKESSSAGSHPERCCRKLAKHGSMPRTPGARLPRLRSSLTMRGMQRSLMPRSLDRRPWRGPGDRSRLLSGSENWLVKRPGPLSQKTAPRWMFKSRSLQDRGRTWKEPKLSAEVSAQTRSLLPRGPQSAPGAPKSHYRTGKNFILPARFLSEKTSQKHFQVISMKGVAGVSGKRTLSALPRSPNPDCR
jgi:hypothetical protein